MNPNPLDSRGTVDIFPAFLCLCKHKWTISGVYDAFAGLSDWSEEDILAQVMAQSQQEYLESLKQRASTSAQPGTSSQVPCLSSPSLPSSSSSFSSSLSSRSDKGGNHETFFQNQGFGSEDVDSYSSAVANQSESRGGIDSAKS